MSDGIEDNDDEKKRDPKVTLALILPASFRVSLGAVGEADIGYLTGGGSKELSNALSDSPSDPELTRRYIGIVARVPAGAPAAEQRVLSSDERGALEDGDLARFAVAYLQSEHPEKSRKVDLESAVAAFAASIRAEREARRKSMEDWRKSLFKGISPSTVDLINASSFGSDHIKRLLSNDPLLAMRESWWQKPPSTLDLVRDGIDDITNAARRAAQNPGTPPYADTSAFERPYTVPSPNRQIIEVDVDASPEGRTAIAAEELTRVAQKLEVIVEAAAAQIALVSDTVVAMSLDFNRTRTEDVERLTESLTIARRQLRWAVVLGGVSVLVAGVSIAVDYKSFTASRAALELAGADSSERAAAALAETKSNEAEALRQMQMVEALKAIQRELEQPPTWSGPPLPLYGPHQPPRPVSNHRIPAAKVD